jgi:hypothetical protein
MSVVLWGVSKIVYMLGKTDERVCDRWEGVCSLNRNVSKRC